MRRFRVRQYGEEGWTYITMQGDLAAGMASIWEAAMWSWSGKLHVQELNGKDWEDLT